MINEIHRSEKITDTFGKKSEHDLSTRLFDCRIGSDEWNSISRQIKQLNGESPNSFNPDARI